MSRTFYFAVCMVCISFLYSQGIVARYHLSIEQAWSQELLDQNTHSLTVIGHQKKYINDLERYLIVLEGRQQEKLSPLPSGE